MSLWVEITLWLVVPQLLSYRSYNNIRICMFSVSHFSYRSLRLISGGENYSVRNKFLESHAATVLGNWRKEVWSFRNTKPNSPPPPNHWKGPSFLVKWCQKIAFELWSSEALWQKVTSEGIVVAVKYILSWNAKTVNDQQVDLVHYCYHYSVHSWKTKSFAVRELQIKS